MASVDLNLPGHIPNFIDGQERPAGGGATFEKLDPATGRELCRVSQSRSAGRRRRRVGRAPGTAGMG